MTTRPWRSLVWVSLAALLLVPVLAMAAGPPAPGASPDDPPAPAPEEDKGKAAPGKTDESAKKDAPEGEEEKDKGQAGKQDAAKGPGDSKTDQDAATREKDKTKDYDPKKLDELGESPEGSDDKVGTFEDLWSPPSPLFRNASSFAVL